MGSCRIIFSAEQAAAMLWRYGEDALIAKALALTEPELRQLWVWAGDHFDSNKGLPLTTRLVADKVISFACIAHFEGALRPLAQERRRAEKNLPERLQNAPHFAGSPF